MTGRRSARSMAMLAGITAIAVWMGDLTAQQAAGVPAIRVRKAVKGCGGFDDTISIHPDRYVPGTGPWATARR